MGTLVTSLFFAFSLVWDRGGGERGILMERGGRALISIFKKNF